MTLEALNKEVAEQLFSQLNVRAFPYMDEQKQSQFIDGLKQLSGNEFESNEATFDRDGVELLRNKVGKKLGGG